jgi:hypothetical protein
VKHDGRLSNPKVSGWTVRTRLMIGTCLIVALGITAAGSTAFLIERASALAALDTHLTGRVSAAQSIVLGPANAGIRMLPPRRLHLPGRQPEPWLQVSSRMPPRAASQSWTVRPYMCLAFRRPFGWSEHQTSSAA